MEYNLIKNEDENETELTKMKMKMKLNETELTKMSMIFHNLRGINIIDLERRSESGYPNITSNLHEIYKIQEASVSYFAEKCRREGKNSKLHYQFLKVFDEEENIQLLFNVARILERSELETTNALKDRLKNHNKELFERVDYVRNLEHDDYT